MAVSVIPSKWINLASPFDKFENDTSFGKMITSINAHEFIVSTCYNPKLFKYNINTNKFNECVHDIETESYCGNIDFDNKEQILYIQNWSKIISINMKTNTCHTLVGAKDGQYFLFVNDCFHIIDMHDNHWIGSIENKSLKTLHNSIDDSIDKFQLDGGKAIYIPSKQCILLIGGYYNDDGPLSNDLWIYKLTTQKWIQINNIGCVFERFNFEAVLTSNEKYIILFGGRKYNKDTDSDEPTDDIFVLDIKDDNNWKIKECKIKCPNIGKCIGTRTGGIDSKNDILVIGFVKECFKLKEFNNLQLPPQYIIGLIGKWYSAEMIHWMQSTDHYGIYLKDLLSSLY